MTNTHGTGVEAGGRPSRLDADGRGPSQGVPSPHHPSRSQAPRRFSVAGVAILAVVAGLALGRFLFLSAPADTATAPRTDQRSLQATIGDLQARVEREPADLAAWQSLGLAAVQQAGISSDPAFYALAERAYERAERLDPDSAATLVGQGSLALALHDFDRALALGRKARELEPFDAAALGVLVDAQVELGRYDDAAEDLQRMLDLKPNLAALARESYLLELSGDMTGSRQAMAAAETAGAGVATDAAAVSVLAGDLALKVGDLPAAAAGYDRAEQTAAGLAVTEIGHAGVVAASGDRPAAIEGLRDIVERTPHPQAAVLLAHLLRAEGRNAEADDAAGVVRALAALQADAGQVVDLELAQFEADVAADPEGAVALARRASRARPDNVFTADALAWALHRAGRNGAAVPHARRALRLGTADAAMRYHAAAIFAEAGRERLARESLTGAFELHPLPVLQHLDDVNDLARTLDVKVPPAWRAAG